MESGVELKRTLEESKTDAREMMLDLKATTSEQRALIFDVFDQVSEHCK